MRRKLALVVSVLLTAPVMIGVGQQAMAHQCTNDDPPECHDTPVYEDWRPNYVPLFDLTERDDEQRRNAQRWREECRNGDQERQQCAWFYGGTSARPYPTDVDNPRPNEVHVGYAANHCFLAEAAHDCDSHEDNEFGTHDPHGGAIYADVCLATNPDSKYCDDGLEDTQVGVTVVDHLPCPLGCADEYHLVRPFDTEYTNEQMEDSQEATARIAADPVRHLCGHPEYSACP
jgi:hypothetical protein